MHFPCSACGKTISTDAAAGALVHCRLCGAMNTVPDSTPETETTRNAAPIGGADDIDRVDEILSYGESKKPWRNLSFLLISLFLFVTLGLMQSQWGFLFTIVIVIFVHELGHLLAMKAVGYRDVRIFFVPLFGGAAAGEHHNPGPLRRAFVSLAGPLPGIVIGVLLARLYFAGADPVTLTAARVFLFVNAFNLLPFYPLDGGRVLEAVLFTRHHLLEVIFKVIAGLALGVMAFSMKSVLLALLAAWVLVTVPAVYRKGVLARDLRSLPNLPTTSSDFRIPRPFIEAAIPRLAEHLGPHAENPGVVAAQVRDLWHRTVQRPAGAGSTFGIIAFYVLSFVLSVLLAVGVEMRVQGAI